MSGFFGRGKTQASQTPAASGLQIQSSVYGRVIPVVYGTTRVAPNLIWYGDFVATAHQSQGGGGGGKGGVGGGGGGKGGGGSVTYTYSTGVAMALSEGPIQGVGNVYVDKNTTSLSSLGFSLFTGTYPQTPWSYLTTKHPGQDLGYNGIGYVAASSLQLGNSPNLPNHNFEVKGILSTSVSGKPDADPSQVIADILTNTHYGVGFPSSRLTALTTYQNYTIANGLWVSPAYTDAAQAAGILDDLAVATNSAFVWSSGSLNLIPYGDSAITANGKTYTPPSVPLFDLTDDDFIASPPDDPVRLVRKRPSDAYNCVQIEYRDRANAYDTSVAEAKDQSSIDQYGLRTMSTRQAAMFADGAAASLSAQLQMQRQLVRNVYTFKTDIRYLVLDPMDIITITDSGLGITQQWVRITDMTLNEDGTIDFVAEEYLAGTGSSATFSYQTAQGYIANYNSSPGSVNTPVIFDASVQIATTGLETWMAVSGGSNWGGCDVYISSDNATYKLAGRINGPARQGVLTSALATGSDPDTTHTLGVSLAMSGGSLFSGTLSDADLYNTLIYVDGELMSYQTATLTGANAYNLTYLRRGAYGTAISGHASGSQFARLDEGVFKYSYDKTQIGQTVYVKFCSFNIWGGGLQGLSDVTPYTHVVSGPPVPPNVTGFQGQQNGNVISMVWAKVKDFALKGYDVGYAPQGTTDWSLFELLTEVEAGTEMTNASVPPGSWTFGIRARDIADQLSPAITTFDLQVTNQNNLVLDNPQGPGWVGTLVGFFRHWTGVLVPLSQDTPAAGGWSTFDKFVPNPVTSASYTTQTVDNGFDDQLRVWSNNSTALGFGCSGIPAIDTQLDSWLSTGSDTGVFVPWIIGYKQLRYAIMRLVYTGITEATCSYIKTFNMELDRGLNVENVGNVVVAAGGSAITFPTPYHIAPLVLPTYTGGVAGLYATASSITTTGCTINVWNPATSTSVGGAVSYKAEGV